MLSKGKHSAGWALGKFRGFRVRTRVLMVIATVLAIPAATLVGGAQSGAADNPLVLMTYTPSTIGLNGVTTLAISITNTDTGNPVDSINFEDNLPTGQVIATPANIGGSCGSGVVAANPGTTAFGLTGGTLAKGGTVGDSCTVSVNVIGTASGTTTNSVGISEDDNGSPAASPAAATLTVTSPATANPVVTANYTPSQIPLNTGTTLTISIHNPDTVFPMTSVGFIDSFPTGSVVATPPGISGSCPSGNFVANAGANQISLTGATLAPNSTCTLSVNITGTAESVESNTITVNATDNGGAATGMATAPLTVVGPPVLNLSNYGGATTIPLNVGGDAVGAGGIVFLIQNTNTTVTLTGVSFTATLPAGLQVTGGAGAIPKDLAGSCGGAPFSLVTTANTVAITGAQIVPSSVCQFAYAITGVAPGTWTTIAPNISSVEGGTGPGSQTTIIVDAPPVVLSQTISASPIAVGAQIELSDTLQNTNSNPLTGVGFTDTLPSNIAIVAGTVNNTCGGTVTASGDAWALAGATLPGNSTCLVQVQVIGVNGGTGPSGITGTIATTPVSNEGGTGLEVDNSITVIAIFPALPTAPTQSVTGCRAFAVSFNDGIPGSVYTETGTFPPGLTLDPNTGLVSGTPTTYGNYPLYIVVTPPFGGTVVRHGYTFDEELCVTPTTGVMPGGHVGVKYNSSLGGSRGTAPYRFQINSGALPTGLSLSQAGAITGTPTKLGTYNFVIYIFDSSNPLKVGTASESITIS